MVTSNGEGSMLRPSAGEGKETCTWENYQVSENRRGGSRKKRFVEKSHAQTTTGTGINGSGVFEKTASVSPEKTSA